MPDPMNAPDPIDAIDDPLLDDLVKGFPGGHAPVRLGDVGKQGRNLLREDLPLPLAVLKRDVLDANGRWTARFLKAARQQIDRRRTHKPGLTAPLEPPLPEAGAVDPD